MQMHISKKVIFGSTKGLLPDWYQTITWINAAILLIGPFITNFIEISITNLRDLIAATGLVILLKWDSNRQNFSPCDIEIWWMTLKNNRTSLLYYVKLCTSFQIHQWIQTGVIDWKRSIWVKICECLCQNMLFMLWLSNHIQNISLKFC